MVNALYHIILVDGCYGCYGCYACYGMTMVYMFMVIPRRISSKNGYINARLFFIIWNDQ